VNRHVNAIAGRLSLRPPQRHSLEILDRITEIVPPQKGIDVESRLSAIRSEFPTVTDFEREFLSLCFALAILSQTKNFGDPRNESHVEL
jgi:type III restriction enzyme